MTDFIKITEIDELESIRPFEDGDHPRSQPLYVMVAGGMGAGKSHVVEQHVKDIDIFDIDIVMNRMRFFDYTEDQFSVAMEVIAEEIEEQYRERKSMVAMGTASYLTGAIDRLHAAKMQGYRTILVHVDAPVYQAILQNTLRMDQGLRGVKKSDEYKIERTTNGAARTVSILRESALVDYFVYYNNHRNIHE